MDEQSAVALLTRLLGTSTRALLGNGDDAVVLRKLKHPLVLSVDASVEGVHFDRSFVSLVDVGYRSHAAAVSDLAAMGASPVCSLSALVVPKATSKAQLSALARGQRSSAKAHDCPVLGGNLARGRQLSITTTVVGQVEGPLGRGGARPGDQIWLLGPVGLSRAGLEILRTRRRAGIARQARSAALRAFRRPQARLAEGRRLAKHATSGIDISDGLLQDAGQIARASGACVSFEWELLEAAVTPELRAVASAFDTHPLAWALAGGEDYALLATGPAIRRPRGALELGSVSRGRGVRIQGGPGWAKRLRGFDHLR